MFEQVAFLLVIALAAGWLVGVFALRGRCIQHVSHLNGMESIGRSIHYGWIALHRELQKTGEGRRRERRFWIWFLSGPIVLALVMLGSSLVRHL